MRTNAVRILFGAVLLLLCASMAQAQTQVQVNTDVGLAADYDNNSGQADDVVFVVTGPANVTSSPFPTPTGFIGTFNWTWRPTQRGSYTITAKARNDDGRSADSDPLAASAVKGTPNKPGKPRITSGAIAMGGTRGTMQMFAAQSTPESYRVPDLILAQIKIHVTE